MAFAQPLTILYANLGMGQEIDACPAAAEENHYPDAAGVIAGCHSQGADEPVHRALKDSGFEEPPFLRFASDAAFCYTMVAAFLLF